MKNKIGTTYSMVIDAMLAAIYVVLSAFVSLNLGNIKITFEALPILTAALLLGPVDGLLVGGIGSLIQQLMNYGITPTTLLWILPHALSGLLVGLYAKKHDFELKKWQTIGICAVSALVVTAFNTLAMYVDSKMYGYYSKAYVFGSLVIKIIAGIVTAVVFSLIIPEFIKLVRKNIKH